MSRSKRHEKRSAPYRLADEADEIEIESAKEEHRTWMKSWFWIIVAFIIALAAGVVVVIVISMEQIDAANPESIDVVLYQSSDPGRTAWTDYHIRAVRQNLDWPRVVYVLSGSHAAGPDEALGVTWVPFSGTEAQAFEYMPDIPGVASHALFLSNRTFPMREVKKTYLFAGTTPRIFNIFREASEVVFFADYLELPTMPCLATDLAKLKESPQTWQDLVFRAVTEERVALRNDMSLDLMIVSTMPDNAQLQFNKVLNRAPLFITFHVGPADPDSDAADALITAFLTDQFPITT